MCKIFVRCGMLMKCVVAAVALFHLTGAQPANAQIAWTVAPFYDSNATDFSKTKLMIKDERNGVIRQMYDESHAVLIIQGQYQIGRASCRERV